MEDENPNINIRLPLNKFLDELRDLLKHRVSIGYIDLEDYRFYRIDLLRGYKMFFKDYITDGSDIYKRIRELKWQNL